MTEKLSDDVLKRVLDSGASSTWMENGMKVEVKLSDLAAELLELRKEQAASLDYNNTAVIPAIVENLKAVGINPERGLSWMVQECIERMQRAEASTKILAKGMIDIKLQHEDNDGNPINDLWTWDCAYQALNAALIPPSGEVANG